MRIKLTKHDRYVLDLCHKIKGLYDDISTHVSLRKKKRSVGEIDVLAHQGDRVHVYEVKCSFRIAKARKQLQRIKKHLNFDNASYYFYCGSSGVITEI